MNFKKAKLKPQYLHPSLGMDTELVVLGQDVVDRGVLDVLVLGQDQAGHEGDEEDEGKSERLHCVFGQFRRLTDDDISSIAIFYSRRVLKNSSLSLPEWLKNF